MFRQVPLLLIFLVFGVPGACAQEAARRMPKPSKPGTELERLRSALRTEFTLRTKDASLGKIISLIGDSLEITISLDRHVPDQLQDLADQTITIDFVDGRLSDLLGELLQEGNFTYIIRNDALVITTKDFAAKHPRAKLIVIPNEMREKKEAVAKSLSWALYVASLETNETVSPITVEGNSLRVVGHARTFEDVESLLSKMSEWRDRGLESDTE